MPHGLIHSWAGLCNSHGLVHVGEIPLIVTYSNLGGNLSLGRIYLLTELGLDKKYLIRNSTLTEEKIDEFRSVHPCVFIRVGEKSSDEGYNNDLSHGISSKFRCLPKLAPFNIGLDKNGS